MRAEQGREIDLFTVESSFFFRWDIITFCFCWLED